MLREYRGDAHVAAWTSAELDAVEIGLLTEAYIGLPLRTYIRTRAWDDRELDAAVARLEARGWMQDDALTDVGRTGREAVEDATDRALRPALEALGDDADELFGILEPWGAAMRAAGGYIGGPVDLWPASRRSRLTPTTRRGRSACGGSRGSSAFGWRVATIDRARSVWQVMRNRASEGVALLEHGRDDRLDCLRFTGLRIYLAGEREADEVESPVTRAGDLPVEDSGHVAVRDEAVAVVEVAVHDLRLRELHVCRLDHRSRAPGGIVPAVVRGRSAWFARRARASTSHGWRIPVNGVGTRARPARSAEATVSISGTVAEEDLLQRPRHAAFVPVST